MSKNLLIIESPNKIETIGKYLKDDDFEIIATVGHIRDLSTFGMGFDEKTLEPKWIVPSTKKFGNKKLKSKKEIINQIKEAASSAEKIYLASDPDREGEAIAWHAYEVIDDKNKAKCQRITFNEITKNAIHEALNNPRQIDMRWVQSQFARRIIDRLVGYKLSKLVRNKLHGTSAGRVQSVALRFIYDREKEIERFKEDKWWTVDATAGDDIKLILRGIAPVLESKVRLVSESNPDGGSGIDFADQISAQTVVDSLNKEFEIYAIDNPTEKNSNPREPYKTSTFQQDAINKLNWNIGKVTSYAQRLYEGVRINGEHTALISYPRTDSIRISNTFAAIAKEYILKNFGEKYYQFRSFNNSKKSSDNIQDAHEAIRVIDPFVTPEALKKLVSREEYSLYKLIWTRTIAAFMSPARLETTIVRLQNNDNKFYTYNRRIIFDGYKKIYQNYEEYDTEHYIELKKFVVGRKLKLASVEVKEHISQPPAHFNQASLIKALDEAGVGRPSTYKSMANMSVERGYAKLENKAYTMLPIGDTVIEGLIQYFPDIVDKEFTKQMENHLDDISNHDEKWKEWILRDFKPKFDKEIKDASEKMPEVKPQLVGRECPLCKSPLLYRNAKRTGVQFIGCSAFPKCKYAEFPNALERKLLDEKCPVCSSQLIERRNKRGQTFVGCSSFPKCHYMYKVDKDGHKIEVINNVRYVDGVETAFVRGSSKKSKKDADKKN